MKKIKQLLKDNKLYIFILITLIFFGMFSKLEFATDTYCVFATPTNQYCQHFLYSGRFISAICLAMVRLLNFGSIAIYTVSYILAIMCTIASLYILNNVIKKDIKNETISMLISILIVINAFSIELYLFLEKGILMLSVLFNILAFYSFTKYLEGRKKQIILTFIYMLIANFSYQGTVGLFVGLVVVYIIKHSEKIWTFIKNNLIAGCCYGIPALVNYLIVKFVFNNTRVSTKIDIMESISLILKYTREMIQYTFNILPKYFFIIILVIVAVICLITILTKKLGNKKKVILILQGMYIVVAVYIATVFPQIMQGTSSIGFAPRNTYVFASIIGILLLFIFIIKENNTKIMEYSILIITIIFLSVQYLSFTNIERNRYILNYMDYYNVLQIKDIVEKYEKETGNIITKVSVYKQNGNQGSYPELWISGDINIKASCPDWCRLDYLRYYLDKKLEETENDEEVYEEYFKGKDWTIFDLDQIIIIGNTIHICLY